MNIKAKQDKQKPMIPNVPDMPVQEIYSIVEQDGKEHVVGTNAVHSKHLGMIRRIDFRVEPIMVSVRRVDDAVKKELNEAQSQEDFELVMRRAIESGGIRMEEQQIGWVKFYRAYAEKGFIDVPLENVKRIVYRIKEKPRIVQPTGQDIAIANKVKL